MTMSRDRALRAITARLNTCRQEALDTAKADYAAANPGQPVPAFPITGPVLPVCAYDDPTDLDGQDGKILRGLTLFTDGVTPGEAYIGDDEEPDLGATLEWILIIPAQHRNQALDLREKGIAEIEAALSPLQSRLEDPDTGDLLAISFLIGNVDFQTHDIGEHWALAVYVGLNLVLDAQTTLS